MVDVPFATLADAMIARTRERNARGLRNVHEAWSALHKHTEDVWSATKANDAGLLRDALVRIGAEAKRAAEDLGLELDGRFGEMAGLSSKRREPWSLAARPVVSVLDLYSRLRLALVLLHQATINEEADQLREDNDPVDLDRLADPAVIRPIDLLLSLHLVAQRGCEDLELTPKS